MSFNKPEPPKLRDEKDGGAVNMDFINVLLVLFVVFLVIVAA